MTAPSPIPRRRALQALLGLPALASLVACSAPVRTPAPLGARETLRLQEWSDTRLRGQVALGQISGADKPAEGYLKKTLAWLWSSPTGAQTLSDSLEDQLRAISLLAALPGQARFTLDVNLQSLEASGLLTGAQAQAIVVYTLREGEQLRYQRRIRASGQTGWVDHLLASDRQRLAKEAALRESLRMLAMDLVTLRV